MSSSASDPSNATTAADEGTGVDELFERFLDTAEQGGEPDWHDLDPRISPAEAERLWTLARETSPIRVERRPEIPGFTLVSE
ncbi:MAG: hypothetical protein K8E66_06180, partial [Phycisphaerales bacterium]|nr:hypothetical protein [Phycisphaerales bacterium]